MGGKGISVDPLIYSLVFGESVLNDAVSIVLFRSFDGYIGTNQFNVGELFLTIGKFVITTIGKNITVTI
jgi:NhaP-type Na+/H+ or K+/H+ antiporter